VNDNKISPVAIWAGVILCVSIFVPAYIFDWLFGTELRTRQLHYDDWQMWQFWLECLENSHAGYPVIERFSEIIDKAKLGLWIFTTPGLPLALFAGLMYWSKCKTASMVNAQSSAVFAKLSDIKEYQGTDGLILTKNVQMKLTTCFTHLLVIGPTGSGKTQSFFLPNIMKLPPTYSAVITDPKGELYQKTAAHQRALGREPVLLKLDCKEVSICWNPIETNDSVAMSKTCQSIVKNKGGGGAGGGGDQDLWDTTAINLLVSLSYAVKALPKSHDSNERPYGNLQNVSEILSNCTFESILGLAKFAVAELGVREVLSKANSFDSRMAPEDTRNSTKFVLNSALGAFATDEVACITAKTDFDFRDLKRRPIALYVSVPEHKVTTLAPVISTLYMQIFDELIEMGEGGRPVFFLMDEFANIGKVIGFPQYVATIRSRNLSVAVCLQSGEQLTRNYSEPEKQEILNNLKVTVVLPGLKEEKSLQYIQTISGKVSAYEKTTEKDDKRAFTKDRLPLHEIREMEDNYDTGVHEALVIFPNKPAYKDRQRRSYSDSEIKALLKKSGTSAFPKRDPQMWVDIKKNCFLGNKDLKFLDAIGTYLHYFGMIEEIPADKQEVSLKAFKAVHDLCGVPTPTKEDFLRWGPIYQPGTKMLREPDAQALLGRRMIETTLKWAIQEGLRPPLVAATAPR